jgi:acyl-CoA thioester hydrolase
MQRKDSNRAEAASNGASLHDWGYGRWSEASRAGDGGGDHRMIAARLPTALPREAAGLATVREAFRFPIRVYYEDTDAGGVVYYANYLKFMERARTEWLSALGFDLAAVEREHGIVFVVHRVAIEFLRPAQLSDRLDVTLTLVELGRARFVADQTVERGAESLTRARVTLACLGSTNRRPARIPAPLFARMEALL